MCCAQDSGMRFPQTRSTTFLMHMCWRLSCESLCLCRWFSWRINHLLLCENRHSGAWHRMILGVWCTEMRFVGDLASLLFVVTPTYSLVLPTCEREWSNSMFRGRIRFRGDGHVLAGCASSRLHPRTWCARPWWPWRHRLECLHLFGFVCVWLDGVITCFCVVHCQMEAWGNSEHTVTQTQIVEYNIHINPCPGVLTQYIT